MKFQLLFFFFFSLSANARQFLHLSDLHYDPHYLPKTNIQEHSCHRGKGSSGKFGSLASSDSISHCDTPDSLLDCTFGFIKNLLSNVDFIIWTGDNARHDNDSRLPLTMEEVFTSNEHVMQKYFSSFANENILIVPSIGNHDVSFQEEKPMNFQFGIGPNPILERLYSIWKTVIPIPSVYSFLVFGSFSLPVKRTLHVFSINTLYFWQRNHVPDCNVPGSPGDKLLLWMEGEFLKIVTEFGGKILISGHIPPSKKQYKKSCLSRYQSLIKRWSFLIEGQLFGHLHSDEWFVQRDESEGKSFGAVFVNSSIRPHFNPSFRLFEYDDFKGELIDYAQYYFPLNRANQGNSGWEVEYSFQRAYNVTSLKPLEVYKATQRVINDLETKKMYEKYRRINTL